MKDVGPGDICWATVAFASNPRQSKPRPVLVVSSLDYARRTGEVIGLAVTSNLAPGFRGGPAELRSGRLPMARSTINWETVVTLTVGQIGRPVARVDEATLRSAAAAVRQNLVE